MIGQNQSKLYLTVSILNNYSGNPVPIKRIAAIDIGTNSFHAVLVDIYSDGSFRTIDTLKEMVQLAKGGLGRRLTDGAIERGLRVLKNIKLLCDSHGAEEVMAYATSAIREAENGGDFIQRSIDELGIKIIAIPGQIEAELIGYAVQHGVQLDQDPVLMVDIGGGSVEFIIGNKKEFYYLDSKKIGVARTTDIFKPSDPVTEEDIKKLRSFYKKELRGLKEALKDYSIDTIVGSSGTMQNIALMIAFMDRQSKEIKLNELEFTKKQFNAFFKQFIRLNRSQRLYAKGLDSKRLDIIMTGVLLVDYLINNIGFKKVKISDQALREGIIIRYLRREMIGLPWQGTFTDPQRRSVFELLRKCQWHEAHSTHVTDMALTLFDALKEELDLFAEDRVLLEYASLMHDIGYHISHSQHHKHALYIIKNAELKGFKEEEINIMANVARYHRRSVPQKRHTEYWELDGKIKKRIRRLSGILRVADGLDRSHYQNVKKIHVELTDDELRITAFTISDPQLEIWGAMRKSHLLAEVTGIKIVIEPSGMDVIG